MNCATSTDSARGAKRPAGLVVLAVWLLALSHSVYAQTRISVIYPDATTMIRKLYQTIIDGMSDSNDVRLQSRPISDKDSAAEIKAWMRANHTQVTVVLGDVPSTLTRPLAADMPVLHGAGPLNDNSQSGVSLASSPAQMFSRLRLLKPNVERIFVVYNPRATGWLIAAARQAARERGLELITSASDDILQSGAMFTHILQQARPGKDAIWLTLDPVVPTNQLLPVLLREAWNKHLVLFSNNPVDVAKGVLFALYPDYSAMGRQLAERAKRQLARPSLSGPEASEHLIGAVNVRTAAHLGITLSDRQRQAFARVFPEMRP